MSRDSKLQMELVDVRTGFQLWGQSYTLKQMEEPALAEDIAREISISNSDTQRQGFGAQAIAQAV